MIPEIFPVFTTDHIHIGVEYGDNKGRYSAIGWLKELFLFNIIDDDENLIQITPEDRKDYNNVIKLFKEVNNINKKIDIQDWEDSNNKAKQAEALNKLRKKMEYTCVTYE